MSGNDDRFKKILRIVETILVLFAFSGTVVGAMAFMDLRHASVSEVNEMGEKLIRLEGEVEQKNIERQKDLLTVELGIKADEIEREIEQKAQSLYHYRNTENHRKLEPAEVQRKEWLEESLERDYEEQRNYVERLEEPVQSIDK